MAEFLVMMHENDHAWSRLPKEEQQALLARYVAWARDLRAQGRMKGGNALADEGRTLRMEHGELIEAPFTETKQVLTGYFHIEATDLAEATRIARDCPALGHGETVIVRPTTDHS